jgi:hypothetical protein
MERKRVIVIIYTVPNRGNSKEEKEIKENLLIIIHVFIIKRLSNQNIFFYLL